MSSTTNSTRTLKTAVTVCRWTGLAMLTATIIMAIAYVTSSMPYLPIIVIALGAIVDDVLVRSRIRAAEGKH